MSTGRSARHIAQNVGGHKAINIRNTIAILIGIAGASLWHSNIHAQPSEPDSIFYHWNKLDYPPHFKGKKWGDGHIYLLDEANLDMSIQYIINRCEDNRYRVKRIPSYQVKSIAMISPGEIWIRLDISSQGQLVQLASASKLSEQTISCIQQTFNERVVNPALKNGSPVGCQLHFRLIPR